MRKRPVSVVIVAISVAWTAWVLLSGGRHGDWRRFGISNGYEVFGGDYWTLLTSMFVHVDAIHLIFNAYWMYVLGGFAEEKFGARYLILLTLISGFCGSCLELSFAQSTGVGLSGVVYAIFGVLWGAKLFGNQEVEVLG